MHDIDFLPAEYRQRSLRRQSKPWQLIVVGAFVALVAAAAATQQARRRHLESQLDALEPSYQRALEQQKHLGQLQARLKTAQSAAELFTYLSHPWPRTQILAALVEPLPADVCFEKVRIFTQPSGNQPAAAGATRAERRSAEEATADLPSAQRDLAALRRQCDDARTIVQLSGTASDGATLHRYLGQLGRNPLFKKAELETIEHRAGPGTSVLWFEATIVVRPGYGQPGGPGAPSDAAVAARAGYRREQP